MQSEASSMPAPPPTAIVTSTARFESGEASSQAGEELVEADNTYVHTPSQYVKLSNISIPPTSQSNINATRPSTHANSAHSDSQNTSVRIHEQTIQPANSTLSSSQPHPPSRDSGHDRVDSDAPRSSATRAIVSILRIQAYRLVSSSLTNSETQKL